MAPCVTGIVLCALFMPAHAQTQLDLTRQVKGTLPKSNGGTGTTNPVCATLSNAAASCSTDTTNASNISSGTLPAARGGAGSVAGALKGNGAGAVTQAACADLSNAAASCSTDTTNAANIASGTLPVARGGTNSGSASGAALDNITGFSSTGIVDRTGAGAYSFRAKSGTGTTIATTSGSLTSGNCAKFDANGNIVDFGAGCGGGGGGGPTLLTTLTASSSASLDFTGLTGYRAYEFRFYNLAVATNTDYIRMRVSQDNGVTWKSGGSDYRWVSRELNDNSGGISNTYQSTATTYGHVAAVGLADATGGASGVIRCVNLGSAVWHICMLDMTYLGGTGPNVVLRSYGEVTYQPDTTAINAVRFYATSGNLSAGVVEAWGIP